MDRRTLFGRLFAAIGGALTLGLTKSEASVIPTPTLSGPDQWHAIPGGRRMWLDTSYTIRPMTKLEKLGITHKFIYRTIEHRARIADQTITTSKKTIVAACRLSGNADKLLALRREYEERTSSSLLSFVEDSIRLNNEWTCCAYLAHEQKVFTEITGLEFPSSEGDV